MSFPEAGMHEIDRVMNAALAAFPVYSKISFANRALFLDAIAENMEQLGDSLLLKAAEETNIAPARLLGERNRTTNQLRAFANMLREGSWVEASIDTAIPDRKPVPKPDLRKMLFPLGPVVVFGASNFPFAYSTAGGDTASALAAGCPVVVKAHPGHAHTSQMVADAIKRAIHRHRLPEGVFGHIHGAGFDTGKALVQHEATAAVGFTGSFAGGRALYDYAHERKKAIPVFSEMGSVNPVVLLPGALKRSADSLARAFTSSITSGMGQFCTKPGLLFAVDGPEADHFFRLLQQQVEQVEQGKMLHSGIYKAYFKNAKQAMSLAGADFPLAENAEEEAMPALASVSGDHFLGQPGLHEEVFGPFSLFIRCRDFAQLKAAWLAVSGQLTTAIFGTDEELTEHAGMLDHAIQMAGRIIFNGVPTGVEVCPSMVHGGPYPATTDSRFTAVGLTAVRRWVRPVCFQNAPPALLPDALQDANPLGIWRLVNNEWTKNPC